MHVEWFQIQTPCLPWADHLTSQCHSHLQMRVRTAAASCCCQGAVLCCVLGIYSRPGRVVWPLFFCFLLFFTFFSLFLFSLPSFLFLFPLLFSSSTLEDGKHWRQHQMANSRQVWIADRCEWLIAAWGEKANFGRAGGSQRLDRRGERGERPEFGSLEDQKEEFGLEGMGQVVGHFVYCRKLLQGN